MTRPPCTTSHVWSGHTTAQRVTLVTRFREATTLIPPQPVGAILPSITPDVFAVALVGKYPRCGLLRVRCDLFCVLCRRSLAFSVQAE